MVPRMTLYRDAKDRLKALGLTLSKAGAEYRVNFPHGGASTEYVTDDLDDAVKEGERMAEHSPPPKLPPLGPLGPKGTRRGLMYRHNRKLAARRKRQSSKA